MTLTRKTISTTSMIALMFTIMLTSAIMAGSNLPTAMAGPPPPPGTQLALLDCADDGVGLAFDGTNLYWPKGLTSFTLGVCDTTGAVLPDIPIVGLNDAISTLTFDVTRNLFWAATADLGGDNRDIYQIDLAGNAVFQFSLFAHGFPLTDGLAYDGEDDTLWISGDVSPFINHYDIDGSIIAQNIPIPNLPNGVGNSGIAAGVGVLYLGFNGETVAQEHLKSDLSFVAQFDLDQGRTEEMECDNVTFAGDGVDAIWTKDAFDSELLAFAVPLGTCPVGGGGGGGNGENGRDRVIGGTVGSMNTATLLVAGAQANMGLWSLALVGIVGAGAAIIYKAKSKKTEK